MCLIWPGFGSFSRAEDLIDRQMGGERVGGTRKRSNDDRIPGYCPSTDITTPGPAIRDPVTRRVACTRGGEGLGARPSNSFADTRVLVPRWTPVNHVTRPRTRRTDYPIPDFPAKFRRFELRRTESIRSSDVQLLF